MGEVGGDSFMALVSLPKRHVAYRIYMAEEEVMEVMEVRLKTLPVPAHVNEPVSNEARNTRRQDRLRDARPAPGQRDRQGK